MDNANSAACGMSAQAALIVEGEGYAAAFLQRLRDGASQPGDLATLVEFLDGGPVLDGFCGVIEKALEASS